MYLDQNYKELMMNNKYNEFSENDLLEGISKGLNISESDYKKAEASPRNPVINLPAGIKRFRWYILRRM